MSLEISGTSGYVTNDPDIEDYEIIHFRLTDSASRALDQLAAKLGDGSFRLSLTEKRKCFVVPLEEPRNFTFSVSDVSSNADVSLECVQLKNDSIMSLGKVLSRLTVNAKEDSFTMAKEKMAQLEDELRKQQTKEVNLSKRKTHRTPSSLKVKDRLHGASKGRLVQSVDEHNGTLASDKSSNSNLARRNSPVSSCITQSSLNSNKLVLNRSLRDRVIHILALRPYERPQLLLRLSRDGLNQSQKDQLDDILAKVGKLTRGSAYCLSPSVVPELDPRWPGYSDLERNRIILLKECNQQRPTGCTDSLSAPIRPVRSEPTSPPTDLPTSATQRPTGNDDNFGRRPTCASAPIAPHSLNKKIAALDLLASGVDADAVARRLGVGRELLDQWRVIESDLRERFNRMRSNTGSTVTPITPPLPQRSESGGQNPPVCSDKLSKSQIGAIPAAETKSASPSVKRARLELPPRTATLQTEQPSRNRPGSNSSMRPTARNSIDSVPSQTTTSGNDVRRLPPAFGVSSQSQTTTTPPLSSLRDAFSPVLYSSSRPTSQFTCSLSMAGSVTVAAGTGGGGSEGESASHTPCSNVSSVGSADNGNTAASSQLVNRNGPNGVDHQHHFRDSTHLGGNPSCTTATCDLDEASDTFRSSADKSISGLASQMEEIDRLYPPISRADQAEVYRAEFQSTYPTYLRMYHSFPDMWRNIGQVHADLVQATQTDGLDSPRTTELANRLDGLLQRTRTPKYHRDLAQLTLISHKLRLLKRRLAESRATGPQVPSKSPPASSAVPISPVCGDSTAPTRANINGLKRKLNGSVELPARGSRAGQASTEFGYAMPVFSSRSAIA